MLWRIWEPYALHGNVLYPAADLGNIKIMEMLLDAGADVFIGDFDGDTFGAKGRARLSGTGEGLALCEGC